MVLIFAEVVHYRMRRIIDRGESAKSVNYRAEAEGVGDSKHRTEHQLRTHSRQSDVPKLLPTVLDTVNSGSLVHRTVDSLEAGYEG